MKKAEEYCDKCHKYGHNRSRCPSNRRSGQGQRRGAFAMSGYNEPPVLGNRPTAMPMGMPMQWSAVPQQHQQFYPGIGMGMGMGMGTDAGMHKQKEQEEPEDFALETYEAVPIELDANFWSRMGVRNLQQTVEDVYEEYRNFMFGNMMQGGLVDKLPLTTGLCKRQHLENPQSNYDMGMCFIAVGKVSRILQSKCKVMLKGKTGLYLCADILKVVGELEHQTTDDIDLVILAKHENEYDITRKIFAQQVGVFIKSCLDYKREKSLENAALMSGVGGKAVIEGNERLTYSCMDAVMRGPGVCGKDLESKNVKVILGDTEVPRRKVKLVDITYSTYDEEIDKLYSRVRSYNIRGGLTFFYLDVRIALMEYAYIIYKNVRQCREFVASGGVHAVGDDTSRLGKMTGKLLTRLKEHADRKKTEAANVEVAVDCASAACFLDNLTEYEQKTMFKFSKSAFLCASIIADLPEYEAVELSMERKQHLRKRIVLMQLRELSEYGIVPKKFSSVMSQTYDVLNEMLDDVILQQTERERYEGAEMHQHLSERLRAIELPPKGRMETRFNRPVAGFNVEAVPFFELPQMIPGELVSPPSGRSSASLTSSGELSVPDNEKHKLWRKKHKAYKKLTKKKRIARREFLKNRSWAVRREEQEQQTHEPHIAPTLGSKFHELTSSDSGSFGYDTPRTSFSITPESDKDKNNDDAAEGGKIIKNKKPKSRSNRRTKGRSKTRKHIKKRVMKNKK
jgi:hypothetical protein